MSESSTSSSSSCTPNEIKALREELNSVAWVQCDRPSCLKWRKIKKADAEKVTDATPWHCSMNKDRSFNACSIEEEDTQQFDNLAKKAKLNVIKSELKPGSLVWAKTSGYCSWPALITEDPANGQYCDGDEIEILWYHVEYIGGQRCHGWVRAPHVEVFGPGKCHETFQSKSKPTISSNIKKQKSFRKKKPWTEITKSHKKERTSYKGQQTLQKAHKEALALLPLPCHARLKTCDFASVRQNKDENYKPVVPKPSTNKMKRCKMQASGKNHGVIMKPSLRSKCVCDEQSFSNNGLIAKPSLSKHGMKKKLSVQSDKRRLIGAFKKSPASMCMKCEISGDSVDMKQTENDISGDLSNNVDKTAEIVYKVTDDVDDKVPHVVDELPDTNSEVFDVEMEKDSSDQLEIKSRLEPFFDFSTSLIDVSKVTRLAADAEKYKAQLLQFETSLSKFFSLHGLSECKSPTWCQMKIKLFEFFLTVFERGGFLMVTARHQWSSVYQELTSQLSKDGGNKTKAFYKKNLYPYELYIQGEDYMGAIEEVIKMRSAKCKSKKNLSASSNQTDQHTEVDKNDLMKELEELDEFLQSNIEGILCENRGKNPETDSLKENSCSDSHLSLHLLAYEDSHLGIPDKRDKSSQALMDLTVTVSHFSPAKSSQCLIDNMSRKTETEKGSLDLNNSQEWTLHELQLLEKSVFHESSP